MFYLYLFPLWALAPLQIPTSLCEEPFYLLYAIFIFIWVSTFSYKAPTKGHYDHTWASGVANMRVCFMNGSMIEHNGLVITCLSIDILKRHSCLLICLSIEVLMSKLDYCFESHKSPNVHAIKKRIWYDLMNSTPHKKSCFYHLPTGGWVGVKLGDVDTSPTNL